MKGKQILISFLVLAALGVYYWFFEVKKKSADDAVKASQELLLPEAGKMKAVEINLEGNDGKISIKKSGEEWFITGPIKAPADNAVCEAAAVKLAGVKYSRRLDNINPDDFGLAAPELKFFITGDNGRKYGILFGPDNPAGETAYAALPGDTSTAYTVPLNLKNEFKKQLFDWRDKKVLNLQGIDIDSIAVNLRDKKYTVVKKEGQWRAFSQKNAAVRADRVEALLAQMKNITAISMEKPDSAGLDKSGLKSPAEYVYFNSGKTSHVIYFGAKDENKSTRFVRGNYLPDIMEISETVYTGISALDNLLEKRPAPFSVDKALKLTVKYGGREITAVKKPVKSNPENWEIKEAGGFSAEEKKRISPGSIIYYVSAFEYKDQVPVKPGVNEEAAYGIKPGEEISVYGENNMLLSSVLIGKQAEGREEFYVKVPLTGLIYTVEKNFIQGLNLPGLEVK